MTIRSHDHLVTQKRFMPKQTFFNLANEKRKRFLDIAIDEFADNEYHKASVSRIVKNAGIAKGSFYQYFTDKKELFFYLLDLGVQEKMTFLQAQIPPDPDMDLFAYFRWLFEAQAAFELSNPRLAEVAYRALFGNAPFGDEQLAGIRQQMDDFFRVLVQKGMNNGSIKAGINEDVTVWLLKTVFSEFGRFLIDELGVKPLSAMEMIKEKGSHQLYHQLVDILQHGLAPINK